MNENQPTNDYRRRIYSSYGKNFQDAPETFDQIASLRWGKARSYHLRGWLPMDKSVRIVDLACGGGKLLHFFLMQGYQQVKGVDISPDQVALSRQVTNDVAQASVIEFLEGNPGTFDLITGFDIVEHFYKDEVLRFLDAAYSALKPGGRLILQTPNADGPWGGHLRYGDFTHEIAFNPNSLGRLLQMIGFSSIAARECDPPPYGNSIVSSIRFLLWHFIRFRLALWNIVETGSLGSGVYTRVFIVKADKPE